MQLSSLVARPPSTGIVARGAFFGIGSHICDHNIDDNIGFRVSLTSYRPWVRQALYGLYKSRELWVMAGPHL